MEENNKTQLEIGDVIHCWDLLMYQYGTYTITSVTKTLAKSNDTTFFRKIDTEVSKPKKEHTDNEYIGEVIKKPVYGSRRFFVVK